MRDLLNKPALETLLRKSWTRFIDKTKLIAFVLKQARDADFPTAPVPVNNKQSGYKVTVSRFELMSAGFLIWVEFSVPVEDKICMGTSEAFITIQGEIQPGNTIGQTFVTDQITDTTPRS